MGGMGRTMSFGATIRDSYHWSSEDQQALEACTEPDCNGNDDHAIHELEAVMLAAANAYVAAHPWMFYCEVT